MHSAGALLCHRPNANVDNIGNDVFLSSPRTADSNDVELMQEIGRPGKSNTVSPQQRVCIAMDLWAQRISLSVMDLLAQD